jgi:hypothetical protein
MGGKRKRLEKKSIGWNSCPLEQWLGWQHFLELLLLLCVSPSELTHACPSGYVL